MTQISPHRSIPFRSFPRILQRTAVTLAGIACAAAVQAAPAIDVVPIPAGTFTYQAAGEFLDQGLPVDAPRVQGRVEDGWVMMRRQVSQAEYARCIQAGACKRLDKAFRHLNAPDMPAVGVSWSDATAYAAWLSQETGQAWRLPTYVEWVRAAAEQYREEGALASDPSNPSVRWLAEYEREISRARERIKAAQPFGRFGVNALGISDMGGNVWEWTDTCFASHSVGALPLAPRENCGVRILAGAHIAAMPDFIRDPRTGACSIGLPPANLGFRLVRAG
ncbi:MAG: SUMF1/EgtB/PvdO family nonheme iron enzyme [Castellaniella sp.]|uniref:formylglycine-generating enzyme family protein n=1 Tax=Castellaniella sp. TaxID=1955812 RepID=UPI003C746647